MSSGLKQREGRKCRAEVFARALNRSVDLIGSLGEKAALARRGWSSLENVKM